MYTNQKISVKWESYVTPPFSVTNGVKQGGVLSPILFGVYIDELLCRLKEAGFGCHIGNVFVGALAYADDIILLAPTLTAARRMLAIVRGFSREYSVLFNPAKSKHVVCGTDGPTVTCLSLDGQQIELVNHSIHLGILIGEMTEKDQITQSISDFTRRVNCTIAHFGKAYSNVKYALFKTFCMSLFGCPLWNLGGKHVSRFFTAWRKCLRRLLYLPARTHCALLPLIVNDHSVEAQLHGRFGNFLYTVLNSSNKCVQLCGKLALYGSGSSVCNSITYICNRYNIVRDNLSSIDGAALRHRIYSDERAGLSEVDQSRAGCIADVMLLRDQQDTEFTREELTDLLGYLATE
jgi:hypothetical protein